MIVHEQILKKNRSFNFLKRQPTVSQGQFTQLSTQPVMHFQRDAGNRAVQRLIQAKLKINESGDKHEQEADRVAAQAIRKPETELAKPTVASNTQAPPIQRMCSECEDELQQKPIQTKRASVQISEMATGATAVQRRCANGRWIFEYDGCSLPDFVVSALGIADKDNPVGGSDTHFGTRGRYGGRPCDNHDRCYQTCGSTRAICDFRMLREMLAVCGRSSASASVKRSCTNWANIYYQGLVLGGGPAHAQRQAQVCWCALRGLF